MDIYDHVNHIHIYPALQIIYIYKRLFKKKKKQTNTHTHTDSRVIFSTLAQPIHLHGQQFLLTEVRTANLSKLDLKNASTSS